jgi:hypothetical protein
MLSRPDFRLSLLLAHAARRGGMDIPADEQAFPTVERWRHLLANAGLMAPACDRLAPPRDEERRTPGAPAAGLVLAVNGCFWALASVGLLWLLA